MGAILGGYGCEDPGHLYQQCVAQSLPAAWWGKANTFALTAGREPGRGFVLLRASSLAALDATADQDLTFSGSDAAHNVPLTRITILKYECVSPGGEGDDNAVFLV